jgi:osmoprotectant transport system substrate-binding protein
MHLPLPVSRIPLLAALALIILAAVGCGSSLEFGEKPPVRIGATNFSEQLILGELYAQVLEADGYPVERVFNRGNREIVSPDLEEGKLDLMPEYLSSYTAYLSRGRVIGSADSATAVDQLRKELEPRKLTALQPAAAANTNGFVLTRATADRLNVRRLSDLAPHSRNLVFGGPPECPARPYCLPGLRDRYNIAFREHRPTDAGGPVTLAALERGQVDVGMVFSTDASIAERGLVLLEDDRRLQLANNVVPVLRNETLQKSPELRRLLDGVSSRLTTADLTDLNRQVAAGVTPRQAAATWLRARALIPAA